MQNQNKAIHTYSPKYDEITVSDVDHFLRETTIFMLMHMDISESTSGFQTYAWRASVFLVISLDQSIGSAVLGSKSCCCFFSWSHVSALLHSPITFKVKRLVTFSWVKRHIIRNHQIESSLCLRDPTASLALGGSDLTAIWYSWMQFNRFLVACSLAASSLYRFSIGSTIWYTLGISYNRKIRFRERWQTNSTNLLQIL